MIDLHRLRRYNLQDGDGTPNDDLAELIGDIHWAADQIERLQARVDELESELEEWKDSCDPGVDTTAVDGYCGRRSSKAGLQAGEEESDD